MLLDGGLPVGRLLGRLRFSSGVQVPPPSESGPGPPRMVFSSR